MLDLEAIKKRCEAATPGPWKQISYVVYTDDQSKAIGKAFGEGVIWSEQLANAALFAAARTDIPALIAEVERLRDTANIATTLNKVYAKLRLSRDEALRITMYGDMPRKYCQALHRIADLQEEAEALVRDMAHEFRGINPDFQFPTQEIYDA